MLPQSLAKVMLAIITHKLGTKYRFIYPSLSCIRIILIMGRRMEQFKLFLTLCLIVIRQRMFWMKARLKENMLRNYECISLIPVY